MLLRVKGRGQATCSGALQARTCYLHRRHLRRIIEQVSGLGVHSTFTHQGRPPRYFGQLKVETNLLSQAKGDFGVVYSLDSVSCR